MEYSFSQLSNIAKSLRERYPIGTRIKLISMGDDPRPIPPGTKGTVEGIDDIATVFCRFDNGRSLGLAYGEDQYHRFICCGKDLISSLLISFFPGIGLPWKWNCTFELNLLVFFPQFEELLGNPCTSARAASINSLDKESRDRIYDVIDTLLRHEKKHK